MTRRSAPHKPPRRARLRAAVFALLFVTPLHAQLVLRVAPSDVLVVNQAGAALQIRGADSKTAAVEVSITPDGVVRFDPQSGGLQAVAPGTAWIWVTSGGKRAGVSIDVVAKPVADAPTDPLSWLQRSHPGISRAGHCLLAASQTPLASLFADVAGALDVSKAPAAFVAKIAAPGGLLVGPVTASDTGAELPLSIGLAPLVGGGSATAKISLQWDGQRLAPTAETGAQFAPAAQSALDSCRTSMTTAADELEREISGGNADAAHKRLAPLSALITLLEPVAGLNAEQRAPLDRLRVIRTRRLPAPWSETPAELQKAAPKGDSGFLGYPSEITYEKQRMILVNAPPAAPDQPWQVFYLSASATPQPKYADAARAAPRGTRLPTVAEWQAAASAWAAQAERGPVKDVLRDLLFGTKEWAVAEGRGIACGGVTLTIGGQPREIPPLPALTPEALRTWFQNPLVLQARDEGEELTSVRLILPVYPAAEPGPRG